MGVGAGKGVAVLARDAQHHPLLQAAPSLAQGRGLAVAGADAWPGDTIAAVLTRLSAQLGHPAASRTDGGGAVHQAVAFLGEHGLARPCLDALSHAVAGMRTRFSHDPPALATLLAACGRVSGTLTHTMLACVAPPTVRTTARCMQVPRLVPWAARVLTLAPPGGAKRGST